MLLEDRPSPDHLVGWKRFEEIETALIKRASWPTSRVAVKNLIYRLRERLRRSGENRFLVQGWKGKGARLALRRSDKHRNGALEGGGYDDA